jgi:hypothetical protein
MSRLRLIVGLMVAAILTNVVCVVWFSPLMMMICLPLAIGLAALGIVVFVIDSFQPPPSPD